MSEELLNMKTSDCEVVDGVLTWVNIKLEEVKIAEELDKIDSEAFLKCIV